MKNATEPRQKTLPVSRRGWPSLRVNAIGRGAGRHFRRGLDPAIVRARLEERRAGDQPNPEYYARRTVERAVASLRRAIPAQEIER